MRATIATEYICCGESYLIGIELPDNEDEALEIILDARSQTDKDHLYKHPECLRSPVVL